MFWGLLWSCALCSDQAVTWVLFSISVATPADWKQGEDVILSSAISNDEAKTLYPEGYKTVKPYLRVVPQPK